MSGWPTSHTLAIGGLFDKRRVVPERSFRTLTLATTTAEVRGL